MSTTTVTPLSGTYVSDPIHSSFAFAVKYMGVSTFRGTLDDVEATLTAGDDGVTLEGKAKVESISIRTPEQFRQHVLSADFFDADNHPEITYRAGDVQLADDGSAAAEGELTIRGVTRPVRATGSWSPEADTLSGRRAHLSLSAVIDRTEFGLNWNADLPSGGKALANDVTITVELALKVEE
jgi:polyisoprenoid-binding protein YceI